MVGSLLNTVYRELLIEKIGLLASDAVPKRLKLEPANEWHPNLRVGQLRDFRRNFARLASGFGKQLRLARAVHCDEPPGSFVHSLADS